MPGDKHSLHSLAWLSWAGAALAGLSSTRNPCYLLLILLCIAVVSAALDAAAMPQLGAAPGAAPALRLSPARFGLLVIPMSALFNALMVRAGDTVLLALPPSWPLIGGVAITLEALAYGALNGVMITGFLAAFQVLNAAVPARALVRRIPRAFFPAAVVTAIALTYIPFTVRQFAQIREAQAVRGHEMRRARDWLPLFLPLLAGGLERALQLAESMAARGFASSVDESPDLAERAGLLAGLLMLAAGWLLRGLWGQAVAGLAAMAFGLACLAWALRAAGRRAPHTAYQRESWSWRDWAATLAAGVAAAAVLAPGAGRVSLAFYPYPALSWPAIDLGVLAALTCLAAPGALLFPGRRRASRLRANGA